jgi:hypothetical protein
VLEVIDTVKRVSGVDFRIETTAPRAGDPARIVAKSDRIRALLGWRPQLDDLTTIARHALDWERKLAERRERSPTAAARWNNCGFSLEKSDLSGQGSRDPGSLGTRTPA